MSGADVEVELLPLILERCIDFFSRYEADPMMTSSPYVFSREKAAAYFERRAADQSRRLFAVTEGGRTAGIIQLKELDLRAGCGTLSVALCNDGVKNRGIGTEAERLLLCYAFERLRLRAVFADAVKRNGRSMHVMEKLGFKKTREDGVFFYFRCRSEDFFERRAGDENGGGKDL